MSQRGVRVQRDVRRDVHQNVEGEARDGVAANNPADETTRGEAAVAAPQDDRTPAATAVEPTATVADPASADVLVAEPAQPAEAEVPADIAAPAETVEQAEQPASEAATAQAEAAPSVEAATPSQPGGAPEAVPMASSSHPEPAAAQSGPAPMPEAVPVGSMPSAMPEWGPTSITLNANVAAGLSYVLWWVSGLIIYFSERRNRYVRFHAVQSMLLTGALTMLGVLVYTTTSLLADASTITGQPVFWHIREGMIATSVILMFMAWLLPMVAAFTGHYLRLPIVGDYAERYSAPVPPGRPGDPLV